MTANQVFEKMLKDVTDPKFHNLVKHLTIKMVHEIDDETMCETYVIDYTNTDFIKCLFMATSKDFPINTEVFMDVKYESCQPVGLIFYDDKEWSNSKRRYLKMLWKHDESNNCWILNDNEEIASIDGRYESKNIIVYLTSDTEHNTPYIFQNRYSSY